MDTKQNAMFNWGVWPISGEMENVVMTNYTHVHVQ
jgi:hypothetical protein